MDKLKLAHEYFMKHVNTDQYKHLDDEDLISWSFDYVDAMQAEAEKRKPSGLPESLLEVDWRVAPQDTTGWKIKEGRAYWIDSDGWIIEDAPSFGFTGTHIAERPHGF